MNIDHLSAIKLVIGCLATRSEEKKNRREREERIFYITRKCGACSPSDDLARKKLTLAHR
jgi:hypothetical protein